MVRLGNITIAIKYEDTYAILIRMFTFYLDNVRSNVKVKDFVILVEF